MEADFYRVHAGRQELRAKLRQPWFAAWWPQFLEEARERARRRWPEGEFSPGGLEGAWEEIEPLAFAFALTEEESFGQAAVERLRRLCRHPEPWMQPVHRDHYPELRADLRVADRCKRLANAYSWLRPLLGKGDRALVVEALRERGGGVIYTDARRGAWWAQAINSNWCAFLNAGLGLAGLVLYETEPATGESWILQARQAIQAMLDLAAEEGAGVEGLGYWIGCTRSLLDFVEADRNATGTDRFVHPFWSRCIDFPLYFSLPDLSGWANFSDCGYPGLGGSALFFAIAARTGQGLAQWLGHRAVERAGGVGLWDLIYYDPAVAERPPDGRPPCRVFPSVHLASFRSDWSREAIFFVLKGGSNAWSHCHLDLNSFQLAAYGERLAIDPGPMPYTPDYWTSVEPPLRTAWHNTLVVDGADQRQPPRYRLSFDLAEGGEAYCRLEDHLSADWLEMVRGDATSAYADMLERFTRDVLYLKPDCFVLFDDLRTREARTQRHFQWLLHSLARIERTATGALVQGQRADLHVTVVWPQPWAAKLLPDKSFYWREEPEAIHTWSLRPVWHHLWNVSPSGSPYPQWHPRGRPLFGQDYVFLVVLQVTPAGRPALRRVEPLSAGPAYGLQLEAGEEGMVAFFNRAGVLFSWGELQTDAEKVVLRYRGGEWTAWAAVRAQQMRIGERELWAGTERLTGLSD